MFTSIKIRIYPNNNQKQIIDTNLNCCRYIYNRMLALKMNAYKKFKMKVSAFDLINHLVKIKKREACSWLKTASSTSLQQSIIDMDKAYKNFFKSGAGYPKFKSKHNSIQSCRYANSVKIKDNKIFLAKAHWIKAKGLRPEITGKVKNITVSREAERYYAAILIDDGIAEVKSNNNGKKVGIDLGVKVFAATSNGDKYKPLNLKEYVAKLKKAQRSLSRKKLGSKNRYKSKIKLATKHIKIRNKRRDFLHKLSTKLSENQTVVVEDLKIKNMSKSAKGTIEKPGKNVKAKSGLNRVILQQGWSEFTTMLEYKLERRGGILIKVDPKYTSQKCSFCGHTSKNNRKSQSRFICGECGFTKNADINAAINIVAINIAARHVV